jgi:hypothetical protein
MLKKLLSRVAALILIVITAILISPTIQSTRAFEELEVKPNSTETSNQPTIIIATIKAKRDDRAQRLQRFLRYQGSPMSADAAALVKIADKYKLDWKLLPAIAGVESTYGLYVPNGSYNPYGWYNGKASFGSWKNASEVVGREIRNRWDSTDPWKIGPSYAASPTWATKVTRYMNLINQY